MRSTYHSKRLAGENFGYEVANRFLHNPSRRILQLVKKHTTIADLPKTLNIYYFIAIFNMFVLEKGH